MHIADNVARVQERILQACERARRDPTTVTLVTITKGMPAAQIEAAHRAGAHHLGENRVQEAQVKLPLLAHLSPSPVWHLVGHLQTNKVKPALSLFSTFHSVDSVRLARALSQRAKSPLPIFLEVNMAGEHTKYGFTPDEVTSTLTEIKELPHLDVRGLMMVAPMAADPQSLRPLFQRLRKLADSLGLRELSMGMTDDFEVAVEEGSTLVRIGRAIFGERRPA
ncbi:MAG: YggS family pyridoxal phosphate-dependent enzyme [Dehalococcoidia bacterium]|nr:YggS family pyridoxal phosphate-dependent enzyme [Dehalococcoidia bacterium]